MAKRWPKKELAKWKLRAARVDSRDGAGGLSSSVIVTNHNRVGVCKILFDDSFVDDLGHRLSYGVSWGFPVYLRLTRLVPGGMWFLQARYLALPNRLPEDLWQMKELPKWAKVYYYE